MAAPTGSSQPVSPPALSSSVILGPQTGHAFGCAWKRRSRGSWYSRSQSGHIGKTSIVVFGRSYGMSRMIVNRGPQFVQLVNG